MPQKVLKSKNGEGLTWREAIVRTLTEMGHPATADEIFEYMKEYVIDHVPDSAKTPVSTIHAELTIHSRSSDMRKNIFRSEGNGHWGLIEESAEAFQREQPEDAVSSKEPGNDAVPTMRQLCDNFLAENPHHFNMDLMNKFRKSVSNFSLVMDMKYRDIANEMLDEAVAHAKTDLARTELAFLVHKFDRMTGANHTLAYDSRTEL